MRTITVNNFGEGIADDIYGGSIGEFAIAKHFDILTYPKRLQPLRGMSTESVTNSKIGNIIVNSSDGLMYGVGEDPNNPGTSGKLWQRSGYGGSDVWQSVPTNNQLSGAVYNSAFLVDFRDCGHARTIHWASTNLLIASNPTGASGASTQALTFTTIGQGLVHPKDKVLYFPYQTSSATLIGSISSNATAFTGLSATAFTGLSVQYRAYCLSHYGNFLAIPLTATSGTNVLASVVGLWSRDTSLTTLDELIPWGNGNLQVLNNLNGTVVGVSTSSANFNGSFQDQDSIVIRGYQGGTESFLIKEIIAQHLVASSHPTCAINPNVNFVYKNRLYFSVNINPNDGISPSYYGLWSVGKNKYGRWTVTMERVATNANTETGVLAAAIAGDFVSMAHTADGTLTSTTNGQTAAATYGATSVYESIINPEMPPDEDMRTKDLFAIAVNTLPLPSGASVVLKYRVDSNGISTDWVTVQTYSTASGVGFVATEASGSPFKSGGNYQFRLESTGGAVINSFAYRYQKSASTNI